jgi:hypothetical protein
MGCLSSMTGPILLVVIVLDLSARRLDADTPLRPYAPTPLRPYADTALLLRSGRVALSPWLLSF